MTTTKNRTVTVKDLYDDGTRKRVTLPAPHWEGHEEFSAGRYLLALYSGPRSGRRFAKFLSQWVGEPLHIYVEADDDVYLYWCERAGAEPVHVEAEEV